MSDTLSLVLDHLGYAHRPQQDTLFTALQGATESGVIVQAGTGTGKSIAVLAAAADWCRTHGTGEVDYIGQVAGEQVVIVTPTKVLQDQYMRKDVPAVEAATGLRIACLKGRSSYACPASPGMRNPQDDDEELIAAQLEQQLVTRTDRPIEAPHRRFGCPGKKRHRGDDDTDLCQAVRARSEALGADVVVTNVHILIFDDMLKGNGVDGLLPEYGLLLVDEAHKIEETLRGFSSTTIAKRKLDHVTPHHRAKPLIDMLMAADRDRQEITVPPSPQVIQALVDLAHGHVDDEDGDGSESDEDDEPAMPDAAKMFVAVGRDGYLDRGDAIMHFIPTPQGAVQPNPKLRLTWVNLAARARMLLTKTPVGLVSATIPATLPLSLGLQQARVLDVGHPFDYSRQARLTISRHSGAFKAAQNTFWDRVNELLQAIDRSKGGSLVLFSSFRDLEAVHKQLAGPLTSRGRLVLKQDRERDNKAEIAARFLDPWNEAPPVLFGSESFATGFDAPGDALTLVAIWKLPYPGLSPVTKAIQNQNRRRYEDMMRVSAAQAIGRLIRTESDYGEVVILDSRGTSLLDRNDPMLSHLLTFGRSA